MKILKLILATIISTSALTATYAKTFEFVYWQNPGGIKHAVTQEITDSLRHQGHKIETKVLNSCDSVLQYLTTPADSNDTIKLAAFLSLDYQDACDIDFKKMPQVKIYAPVAEYEFLMCSPTAITEQDFFNKNNQYKIALIYTSPAYNYITKFLNSQNLKHKVIKYKNGNDAWADVLSGQVDFVWTGNNHIEKILSSGGSCIFSSNGNRGYKTVNQISANKFESWTSVMLYISASSQFQDADFEHALKSQHLLNTMKKNNWVAIDNTETIKKSLSLRMEKSVK